MTLDPYAAPGSDTIDFMRPALGYARRGWRVLPIHEGEKRPALSDWPSVATTDAHQIADWWVQSPNRNIGLATGGGSGFFVLDIDPKNGGTTTLASLEGENGPLPHTYSVRTGSGGRHYYFLMPEWELSNSPGQLRGTGIDVRGNGGQVVAPPSVTAVGSYSVLRDDPIVAAPDWLLALLKPRSELHVVASNGVAVVPEEDRPQLEAYVNNAVRLACAEVAAATQERNNTLNNQVLSLAGIAAHDHTLVERDALYEAMHDACVANGLVRDDGRVAFRQTFQSAWTAGLTKPRQQWPPKLTGSGFLLPFPRNRDLPTVNISSRKLNELVDEVLGNIAAANDVDPEIFAHGSEVVKVVGQPVRTVSIDANMLAYEADERMHFEKTQPRGGLAVANAPARVVDTIMSLPSKPFPNLTRLSYTPFFAPSGRYVDQPGYDQEAQTYYAPPPGLTVPEIPAEPTRVQVTAARDFILQNILVDFPFVDQADRAHAVALMLLPFVRDMIDGPTPLHNIEAPTPGSGKGLLMKVLLSPATGGRHVTCGAGADNEEWEKRLVSFLRLSPQALVIDNVNEKVSSGFLCTALTEPEVSSRLLGASTQVTMPVRTVWVMTANNPKFSDEVIRRTVRIRVDAGVERPEDRSGFRHADLAAWAASRRGELIAACCTMIRGWVAQGAPENFPAKPLGSFERWHGVMSGLLEFLEMPGLLANKEEFLSTSDDESQAWDALVKLMDGALDLQGNQRKFTAGDLAEMVTESGISIDLGRGDNKALMMGRELAKQRDRWHSGRRFKKTTVRGKTFWHLVGTGEL
jgi:hypothetical protein